jgi:hypothetical protein
MTCIPVPRNSPSARSLQAWRLLLQYCNSHGAATPKSQWAHTQPHTTLYTAQAMERLASDQLDKMGTQNQGGGGEQLLYPWPEHDTAKGEIVEEIDAFKRAIARRWGCRRRCSRSQQQQAPPGSGTQQMHGGVASMDRGAQTRGTHCPLEAAARRRDKTFPMWGGAGRCSSFCSRLRGPPWDSEGASGSPHSGSSGGGSSSSGQPTNSLARCRPCLSRALSPHHGSHPSRHADKKKWGAWEAASTALPCLGWLRGYRPKEWLLVRGVLVACALSLAGCDLGRRRVCVHTNTRAGRQ